MPEGTTQGGTQADPNPAAPGGHPSANPPAGAAPTTSQTTQPPSSGKDEPMSLEEAKKLRKEANKLRAKLKEIDEKKAAKELAKMDDLKKAQTQLATAQEQLAVLQIEQQTYRLAREIAKHAPSLNLIDPDAAMLMLQAGDEIEYDDTTGMPTNVAKLLEKLVAAKPYLVSTNLRQPSAPPSSGGATNPGRGAATPQGGPARPDPKELYKQHRQSGLADPAIWKR